MIISAEQLHALITLAGARKIDIAEIPGVRPLSIPLTPGEEMLAQIIARLPSGIHLVGIKGGVFAMELPSPLSPGKMIRLTFLGSTPRPTFALSKGVQEGVPVTISHLSRLIGRLMNEKAPSPPSIRDIRLMEAPPDSPWTVATLLRGGIRESGLFYERHLLLWSRGKYPLDLLLREPQGKLSLPHPGAGDGAPHHPSPGDEVVDSRTRSILREQLSALSSRAVEIGGECLPGVPFRLSIEEREGSAKKEPERSSRWRSRLSLSFPHLGELDVSIDVSRGDVTLEITTSRQESADLLEKSCGSLSKRLENQGLSPTMRIRHA